MEPPAAKQWDGTETQTIELPPATTQRALHEAIGHLYDQLALEQTRQERETELPDDVFDAIEALYVATAEESISRLEISYELETER
ncbi:hypothetical protein C493_10837 [Natronolimnohabitans innermongolicus JCM 12255]|uniref:Uncharacterized protein n=2 Tax=Natronolimnohabitans innermongolicus TaxID=253107 RepID=L9X2Q0_9EURY|nr:hypothetical protein [Natronolimnohabitans innermongolicus]ELY55756.1 hypothetical protein C493_10837 [Natronolimnohabitans innermongolicus JCM 12255]